MCLLGPHLGTAQAPSDLDFARGVRLQQAGDLEGACRAYESALKQSPRRIHALSNLGMVFGALGNCGGAIKSFQSALQVESKHPAVLFNLGITYLQCGQNENARRSLTTVLAAQPENYTTPHYLGLSLLKLGRTQQGVAELETVIRAHPRTATPHILSHPRISQAGRCPKRMKSSIASSFVWIRLRLV